MHCAVSNRYLGFVCEAISSQVKGHNFIVIFESFKLVPPAVPQLREAMYHQHQLLAFAASSTDCMKPVAYTCTALSFVALLSLLICELTLLMDELRRIYTAKHCKLSQIDPCHSSQ